MRCWVSQSQSTRLQALRGFELSEGGAGAALQPGEQDEAEAAKRVAWKDRRHFASRECLREREKVAEEARS